MKEKNHTIQAAVARRATLFTHPWAGRLFLYAILLFAFCVRFYHLETPSMWWDEILVPMTARYPLEYIFSWAKNLEVNSPYYVVWIKGVLLAGDSDFCLRLSSALAGVAGVWLLARVGERVVGRNAGLTAALLLAAWPLHILLSRQVRPYALFVLALIFATQRLLRLVEEDAPDRRNLLSLGLAYLALFSLHFMAVPVVLSHGAFVLLAVLILEKGRPAKLWRFAVVALAGFFCIAPFFVNTFLRRNDMLLSGGAWDYEIAHLVNAVFHVVFPLAGESPLDYNLPPTAFSLACGTAFLAILAALCFLAYRKRPALGLFFASSLFVPLLLFLLLRQPIWRPRHLAFLLPPLTLLLGATVAQGFAAARRLRFGAVVASLAACALLPAYRLHGDQLYGPQSYPDVYKSQARELADLLHEGVVVTDNPGDFNAIAWYLRRFMAHNPFEFQSLGEDEARVLRFVAPENFAATPGYQREFLEHMGPPASVTTISKGSLHTYRWTRDGVAPLAPGERADFSAKPWEFYRGATALRDLTTHWQGTPFVHPTRNGEWAWFSKDYRLGERPRRMLLDGEVDFFSSGAGNAFILVARLDGGETVPLVSATDACGGGKRRFKFVTPGPAQDVRFLVRMRCAAKTPQYPGSNLESVGFRELRFQATPLAALAWGSASLVETFQGLTPEETSPEGNFRWGHGPETSCTFQAKAGERIRLDFAFCNVLPDQSVQLLFNGRTVAAYDHLPRQKWLRETIADTLSLTTDAGENRLVFRFAAYNGQDAAATFAPGDTRPLAAAFTRLRIEKD